MFEAVGVVLLKLGKDLGHCTSYILISLLNVDTKILAKVLVNCLNQAITALVNVDQSGFMPGRGTNINIRRLGHVAWASESSLGVVASLDAEKVFLFGGMGLPLGCSS